MTSLHLVLFLWEWISAPQLIIILSSCRTWISFADLIPELSDKNQANWERTSPISALKILLLVNSFMQISVDDTNEPFAIKCCVTTQTKALVYIYWLLMIRLRKTGVTFGVKFLSRSSFFSSSSAHCLVFGFVCDWHLTLHLIICFVRQNVKTASTFLDFLNEQTTMRRLQITRDEFHQKKLSALLICVVIVRA